MPDGVGLEVVKVTDAILRCGLWLVSRSASIPAPQSRAPAAAAACACTCIKLQNRRYLGVGAELSGGVELVEGQEASLRRHHCLHPHGAQTRHVKTRNVCELESTCFRSVSVHA